MTFGADHYIPILKVKRGEKAALTLVAKPLQKRITPLLEIVQRTDKLLNAHLETAFKGLSDAVQPYPPLFLGCTGARTGWNGGSTVSLSEGQRGGDRLHSRNWSLSIGRRQTSERVFHKRLGSSLDDR